MTLNTATLSLVNQIKSPALISFSKTIASLTDPLVLLALSAIISIYLYRKKQTPKEILLIATSIITALAITIIKNTVKAPRPGSMLLEEAGYSFPSGHATFAVVFFGLMIYIFAKKEYKTPAIITSVTLIAIIAFTRIYLQVHYLTDVIAGLALGSIILTTSILIHKKLRTRTNQN